jgi:L-amino acid N-acyltransferase YncA
MSVSLNTIIVQPGEWLEIERKQAVDASRYGRYFEDRDFSNQSAKALLLDQFERLASNQNTIVVKVYDESTLKGVAILRKSPWDTEHFGFGVAILEHIIPFSDSAVERFEITKKLMENVNLWLNENKIDFISARVPSLDLSVIQGAEEEGFRFIESWVYSKFNLKEFVKPAHIPNLRYARAEDKALMLEYSKGAFVTQRFHADPRFSTQKADELYEKWVASAFEDPTQQIAVLDVEEKPAAFMIYYQQTTAGVEAAKYAMWKFTVIDPAMRGKGVGKVFFDALKAHHQAEGSEFIESGVTLRNLPSMNLHNSLNFKIISSLTTLHKWQF